MRRAVRPVRLVLSLTLALALVLALGGCDRFNAPPAQSGAADPAGLGPVANPDALGDAGDRDPDSPQPAFSAQPGDVRL